MSSADKAEECSVVEAPTRMMFPFFFAAFFTLRDGVLFSLSLVAFSLRCFFLGGGLSASSWLSSSSNSFIFSSISLLLPTWFSKSCLRVPGSL